MKYTHKIALILLIIGGLNWGLYGLVSLDLVDMIFGQIPLVARLVYVFVGLSALYITIESFKKGCHCCNGSCCDHDECDDCDDCDDCCDHDDCDGDTCKVEEVKKEESVVEESK